MVVRQLTRTAKARTLAATVEWAALAGRLAAERRAHPVGFRQSVPRDGGPHPLDLLADPGPAPDAAALAWRLGRLPPRHRDVLVRYVGHGEAVADLAAELGVSPERVRQLVSAAVRRAGGPG